MLYLTRPLVHNRHVVVKIDSDTYITFPSRQVANLDPWRDLFPTPCTLYLLLTIRGVAITVVYGRDSAGIDMGSMANNVFSVRFG